ncbi:hypothetical protein EDC01DRAFT_644098, partial [Geopyxis carbonaria]
METFYATLRRREALRASYAHLAATMKTSSTSSTSSAPLAAALLRIAYTDPRPSVRTQFWAWSHTVSVPRPDVADVAAKVAAEVAALCCAPDYKTEMTHALAATAMAVGCARLGIRPGRELVREIVRVFGPDVGDSGGIGGAGAEVGEVGE